MPDLLNLGLYVLAALYFCITSWTQVWGLPCKWASKSLQVSSREGFLMPLWIVLRYFDFWISVFNSILRYSTQSSRCLLLLIFAPSRRSWRWCWWSRSISSYFSNYLTFLLYWTFVFLSRFGCWPILLLTFWETIFLVWPMDSSVLSRGIFNL
jgi:hypothetical protein